MEKIKNLTSQTLSLVYFGIELQADESREISSFSNRSKIQNYAEYLNDLVYQDKIIVVGVDGNEFSKVESIQYFSNAYNKVLIENVSEVQDEGKFYYVEDYFYLYRNAVSTKTFKGKVQSMSIVAHRNDISVKITTGDGLVLPEKYIYKRQAIDLEFKGKLKDPIIELKAEKGNNNLTEIYIDGYSILSVQELQTFIDNWRE